MRAVLQQLVDKNGWAPESEIDGRSAHRAAARGRVDHARAGRAARALGRAARRPCTRRARSSAGTSRSSRSRRTSSASRGSASASIRSRGARTSRWVPKQRYGDHARVPADARRHGARHDAAHLRRCRRTSTTRARRTRCARCASRWRSQPIVTAMFANSPFDEGRPSGDLYRRARCGSTSTPTARGSCPRCGARRRLPSLHRVGARRADVHDQAERRAGRATPGRRSAAS